MKWGIVGTGNMGSVLLHALTTSHAVSEKNVYLYNRTFLKAYQLKSDYPDVHVCQTIESIINECDYIFLCAKPKEIIQLAYRIKDSVSQNQTIISITSSIAVNQLAHIFHKNVARIIPSITNRACDGVTLMTFNEDIDLDKKHLLIQTFKHFSKPVEIEEEHVRIASDIVSCGPAFYSFIIEKMIEAAFKQTGIPTEKATILSEQMMIGYGKLFEEKIFNLDTLKEKVMVKGGITGEGMKALENSFQEVFENVFSATHHKFYTEKEHIDELIKKLDDQSN
ncbi:late competence protein ComER [Bacillaceae bacterium W0354]